MLATRYTGDSIERLTDGYKDGYVSKNELAASLRAFHSAREEFASPERIEAAAVSAGFTSDGKIEPSKLFV